jgi:hypothetical protein
MNSIVSELRQQNLAIDRIQWPFLNLETVRFKTNMNSIKRNRTLCVIVFGH